jgi:acetylornithine deacetylase
MTTLEILDRLVAFASVTRGGNLAIAGFIRDFLQTRGFEVFDLPDDTGEKCGLFARLGGGTGGVLLSGHMDVVPVAGQNWSRDPFRLQVEQGRAYGRGTTDMKGYLAAMLTLADRAVQQGQPLKQPLKLAFSYDEEIGCAGIRQMIGQLAGTIGLPDRCFIGEPTQMQVATGHKGKAALRAHCTGQAGHSALAPRFVNALHLAADFVTGLRDLQQDWAVKGAQDADYDIPYSTLHVGKLSGGEALNIVPDKAQLDFEFRHLAADDPAGIMAQLARLAKTTAAPYRGRFGGAAITLEQVNAYPGLAVAADAPVVGYAQKLAQTNSTTRVAFGTEAGFFAALGIPAVVCGPGDMAGQGHQPDEYITLAQLAACDQMLARLLDDITG